MSITKKQSTNIFDEKSTSTRKSVNAIAIYIELEIHPQLISRDPPPIEIAIIHPQLIARDPPPKI